MPDAPWEKYATMGQSSDAPPWEKYSTSKENLDATKLDWSDVPGQALRNSLSSAGNFAKSVAEPFLHPITTAKNMGKLGVGLGQETGLVPGESYKKVPEAVGQFFMDRYGGEENLKKTIATDPVGFAGDVATILSGGELALARIPGTLGRVGEVAGSVGRAVDPLNAAAKTAGVAKRGIGAVAGDAGAAKSASRTDVARALQRDQITPQEAAAAGKTTPGAILPDVGGENTRGLMERIAQTPGAGRTIITPFLTERQSAQMDRLSNDLTGLTGTKRTALQAISETMEQRKNAAQPLYQQAYEDGEREIWSPTLERLSSSPSVRSAMQGAVRIWQDNAVADGFGAMNPSMVDRGGLVRFGGSVPVFPNLQFWDYTKRILDDKISAAKRAGQNQKVRTLTQLTSQIRQELDTQVPSYHYARQAWAGPSTYLDAIETGRNILARNEFAEEFENNFKSLGGGDRAAVREGAVSSIIGRMGSDPAKLGDMTKYLRSPEMRRKIAAIMPSQQAANKWLKRLEFEIKSSELTGQSLKNSATARRLAEMQDADGIVGDLVADAFTGTAPMSLLHRLTIGQAKKIRDRLRSRRDEETAKILTNPNYLEQLPKILDKSVLPRSPWLNPQTKIDPNVIRRILQGARTANILGGGNAVGSQ